MTTIIMKFLPSKKKLYKSKLAYQNPLTLSLLNFNTNQIKQIVRGIANFPSITFIEVTDSSGNFSFQQALKKPISSSLNTLLFLEQITTKNKMLVHSTFNLLESLFLPRLEQVPLSLFFHKALKLSSFLYLLSSLLKSVSQTTFTISQKIKPL